MNMNEHEHEHGHAAVLFGPFKASLTDAQDNSHSHRPHWRDQAHKAGELCRENP